MAITLTLTCENADQMLRELSWLAKGPSPYVKPIEAATAKEQPAVMPNGPDEPPAQPQETPVPFEKPVGRRGRPPKSEVVAQASSTEPQAVTPDDCIEAVKTLVARTGDILAPGHVLSTFGVKKTRELTDDNRAAFVAACAAYVAEGSQAAGAEAK